MQEDIARHERSYLAMEIIKLADDGAGTGAPDSILEGCSPLMSTADTGAVLGLTQAVVRDLCRGGKLPSVKIGRRVYIPRKKLEEQIMRDMTEKKEGNHE